MNRIHITDEDGKKTTNWFDIDSAEEFNNTHRGYTPWVGTLYKNHTLYLTASKKWVMEDYILYNNGGDHYYRIITEHEANEWLLINGYDYFDNAKDYEI